MREKLLVPEEGMMRDAEESSLLARVEQLESDARLRRKIATLSVVTAISLATLALASVQSTPAGATVEEVRAKRFVLVGKDNEVLAELTEDWRGGKGLLTFPGRDGHKLEIGTLGDGGVGLLIHGSKSSITTIGTSRRLGTNRIKFRDSEGMERLEIGYLEKGQVGLLVRDSELRTRVVVVQSGVECPEMKMLDQSGEKTFTTSAK
jgi:hypothetical protein